MMQLTGQEWAALTLNPGRGQHRKYLPYAFTERGVGMLSSLVNSNRGRSVVSSPRYDHHVRIYLGTHSLICLTNCYVHSSELDSVYMQKRSPVIVDSYSAAQAAKVAGLSLHMIDYLCRNGIVEPSSGALRGRGRMRQYQYTDIVLLKVVAKLLNTGISVLRCKKSLAALRRRYPRTSGLLRKKYLVTDGDEVFLQNNGVLERIASGQMSFAFVLDLAPIRSHVSTNLEIRRTG
jgi:DNA-binding transcriptional MerR regulator